MGEDAQGLEDILRRITITLGDPALQYVLASEGNTSVKTANGKRMIIKAGGTAFLNPNFVAVEVKENHPLWRT